MKKLLWIGIILFAAGRLAALPQAAGPDSTSAPGDTSRVNRDSTRQAPQEFIFKPIIGLGTGMFTWYGDINNKRLVLPQTSRIGYELSVSQNLSSFLNLRFYVLFGKLGANERSATRNLNFESQIRMGGINLSYNFDQLLPKKRNVEPYITVGFESLEFLSKTDLYDANGNKYYYWSDGSIRNLDQNDPNAANAIYLVRDYKYESDIREMNLDGFGKYPERTWAYTGGAGMTFLMHKQMSLRIGTALHYTMTDYIDGVTGKSQGMRKGDSRNDMFLMTSFSLHYEFAEKPKKINPLDTTNFNDVDFFALDLMDRDGDGVPDPKDSCQDTPKGVPVDAKGCPLDDDHDYVPNYMDDELDSKPGAVVDEHGVTLSDSLIALRYRMYVDSTGEFNDRVVLKTLSAGEGKLPTARRQFTVLLAKYTSGVPREVMDKLLNIEDVKSIPLKDSTTAYISGTFNRISDAEQRVQELKNAGFTDAKVVYKENDQLIEVKTGQGGNNAGNITGNNTGNNTGNYTGNNTGNTGNNTGNDTGNSTSNASGTVYRVQLGAFSKKINKAAFTEVPDAIELKTEDGLYKYITGSFKSPEDAKAHCKRMQKLGYNDAFVVAYQDGRRIGIEKPDNNPVKNDTGNNQVADKGVTFRVQVGVFSKEPPPDMLAKFSRIKDLVKEPTGNGQTRYLTGSFKDYKSAQDRKNEMHTLGIDDAFIQAYHNGQPVSIQEALDILKE